MNKLPTDFSSHEKRYSWRPFDVLSSFHMQIWEIEHKYKF